MENVGEKIKKIRRHFELSQDRFGYKIGLSGKTISSYETSNANPPLYVLERITEVYKVSIFDIPMQDRKQLQEYLESVNELLTEVQNILTTGIVLP